MNFEAPQQVDQPVDVVSMIAALDATVQNLEQIKWEQSGLSRLGEGIELQAKYQLALSAIKTWMQQLTPENSSETRKVGEVRRHLEEINRIQAVARGATERSSEVSLKMVPFDQQKVEEIFTHLATIRRVIAGYR